MSRKQVIDMLRSCLETERFRVRGKTFDQAPDAFKNIEGLKVRIRHLEAK